ncbi:hypothetical protein CWE13_05050 [Aliidiomarina shirensis]|uniref:Uncharacterized protein n=1 Tax=Aliidiomarina shirensis TaxID=1048642 RepID=A0A432WU89_9GAMM|nr:hypothetical protein CWE13_05050 [Aliidiomarina shirensis]
MLWQSANPKQMKALIGSTCISNISVENTHIFSRVSNESTHLRALYITINLIAGYDKQYPNALHSAANSVGHNSKNKNEINCSIKAIMRILSKLVSVASIRKPQASNRIIINVELQQGCRAQNLGAVACLIAAS